MVGGFERMQDGFERSVGTFELLPLHGERGIEEQDFSVGGGGSCGLRFGIGDQELRFEEAGLGGVGEGGGGTGAGFRQRRVGVAVGDDIEAICCLWREAPGGGEVFVEREVGGFEGAFSGVCGAGRKL